MRLTGSKIISLFSFLAVFVLLVPAYQAWASGLVPCGGRDNPCTICYMILTIQNIISFGLRIFVVIGILMVVVAGITYIVSAGNTGMMDMAKGFLKNALIGFGLMLGAWLIVNTTMLVLGSRGDLGIGITNWYNFTCVTQSPLIEQQNSASNITSNATSNIQKGTGCCPFIDRVCYSNYTQAQCTTLANQRKKTASYVANDANCSAQMCDEIID